MKQDFIYKLITYVDDEIVNNIINNIEEKDWYIEDYRQSASSMSKTNSIPIFHTPLCAINDTFETFKSVQKNKLYYKYIQTIVPVLKILKNFYNFNYYTAFLSRLSPKNIIEFHHDTGLFLESCNRIHLPLKTNSEIFYHIKDRNFNWLKGCLYEFDNTNLHGVINNSDEFRIHLVINLYQMPNHLLNQLEQDDFLLEFNNETNYHPRRMECR